MALDAALPRAFFGARSLARGLTARVGVTLIVAGSFAVRVVASAAHPVPRYFPDEYIYTAIARSLGEHGRPLVRGSSAHFPALLEPLLAAPFQALFSPQVAYRLTQGENSLLMSLAAVPVYLLARRLSLSATYGLACAAFAVLIPDLVYTSYTLADPVGYPFALAALTVGVIAVDNPTRRSQLGFLALAVLATLARVQYVVLPVMFLVAAIVVDRRRVLRTQRLPLMLCALPLLAALALGPGRVLGYYSNVAHLHVSGALLHWAIVDVLLLAMITGVVLVPGAIVALARPHGRAETAFAACVAVFAAGLLTEAALYASNGSDRFQERYLFALLPLVPVAFGLYLKHGRPGRIPVVLIAVGLFLISVRVPVSGYAAALGKTDSPFLFAVTRLQGLVGTANASLVVALLAALGAAGAVAVSRRGGAGVAVGAALLFAALTSAGAMSHDSATAREVRNDYLRSDVSWVDATGLQDVTLVQTVGAPQGRAIEQLYWNRNVTGEALLGGAEATDVYAAPRIRVARDGTLTGVGGNVLFEDFGATARFANATLVARAGSFSLWSAEGAPRLELLEEGRYSDGWLGRSGSLTVWPDASGHTGGTLRFELSLPPGAEAVDIRFGKARYRVEPGHSTDVTTTVDSNGPLTLPFTAARTRWLSDLRVVSVFSSEPTFSRAGGSTDRPTSKS